MLIAFPPSPIYKQRMGCNRTILIFFSQNDYKLAKKKKEEETGEWVWGEQGRAEKEKNEQISIRIYPEERSIYKELSIRIFMSLLIVVN